jgi:hypothetical protein
MVHCVSDHIYYLCNPPFLGLRSRRFWGMRPLFSGEVFVILHTITVWGESSTEDKPRLFVVKHILVRADWYFYGLSKEFRDTPKLSLLF